MVGDLTDAFAFSVHAHDGQRVVLKASGVFLVINPEPCRFGMWITAPQRLPSVNPGSVLVECRDPLWSYVAQTDGDRELLGHLVGQVFCAFVQGAVLGWDVVEHDIVVVGQRRDEIAVHKYLGEQTLYDMAECLAFDEQSLRRLCREDMLSFAVAQHESLGARQSWTLRDFFAQGFQRLPYGQTLGQRVRDDLIAEERLGEPPSSEYDGTETYLAPSLYDDTVSRTERGIQVWRDRLVEFGRRKKWIPEEPAMAEKRVNAIEADQRRVFVVHGRDERLRESLFQFLRALGLDPIEWEAAVSETGRASPHIGDVLEEAFGAAQAVVVLLTGDDEARMRKRYQSDNDPEHETELTPQPRANVLFEAGMAFGKHPARTVLVQFGDIRPFSDIAGRHVVRFTGSPEDRNKLATRLRTAGCPVNTSGQDWLQVGEFSC